MADRDFLKEIKEAEAEAVLLVEQAREESQLKRQAARQEAGDRIDEAYQLAVKKRQEKIEEAEAGYRDLVADVSPADGAGSAELPGKLLDQAAASLAERIIGILEHC